MSDEIDITEKTDGVTYCSIDDMGRVTIPESILSTLGIHEGDELNFEYDEKKNEIKLHKVGSEMTEKDQATDDTTEEEKFNLLRPIEKFWMTLKRQNNDASDLYESLEHRKNYYGASYGMSDAEIDMCLITEALLPWAPYLKAHPDSTETVWESK